MHEFVKKGSVILVDYNTRLSIHANLISRGIPPFVEISASFGRFSREVDKVGITGDGGKGVEAWHIILHLLSRLLHRLQPHRLITSHFIQSLQKLTLFLILDIFWVLPVADFDFRYTCRCVAESRCWLWSLDFWAFTLILPWLLFVCSAA